MSNHTATFDDVIEYFEAETEKHRVALRDKPQANVGLGAPERSKTTAKGAIAKHKGLFEKVPGSGVWWIRYADATGRIRREKAGTKSVAITLYRKRKTEALQNRKLPERLRRRNVPIPMKVVSDSDLIPVTHSDAKPVTVGAKRRWRCYGA